MIGTGGDYLLTFRGKTMVAAIPPSQRPSVPLDVDPPEPHAAAIEAADETEMPLPSDPRTFFLGGLFGLGVLAALYVASSIILPVMLALVLNLLLQPAVRPLGRLHLPRAVGALLTVFLVIGALVGLVAALSVPATTWAERLPEGVPRLEAHLRLISGPIHALQKVIQQAEQAADAPPAGARLFRFAAIWA
jgi:predicted PurR-regulated permease PerM